MMQVGFYIDNFLQEGAEDEESVSLSSLYSFFSIFCFCPFLYCSRVYSLNCDGVRRIEIE